MDQSAILRHRRWTYRWPAIDQFVEIAMPVPEFLFPSGLPGGDLVGDVPVAPAMLV
jgi:hypothetical protein